MTFAPTIVRTTSGLIRGSSLGTLNVFRGIPYARPPVGPLRLTAPEPARPWNGLRDCTLSGPSCPQPPPPRGALFGAPAGSDPDQWLTVNVWAPLPHLARPLPVMVWIHGGGYAAGHGADPVFDGGRLALEGQVVVVTLNYRLGFEGFALVSGAPANRGLLDQVAALQWVRDNAAAFGGDPGRVTVFGQSAGAGSVAALMAMPAATALFHQAIAQSVPRTYFTPEIAEAVARLVTGEAGRTGDRGSVLDTDPQDLVAAGEKALLTIAGDWERWGALAEMPSLYSPVVDGEVLPADPWSAQRAPVPLLAGHTRDEYRLFLSLNGRGDTLTEADVDTATRHFGPPRHVTGHGETSPADAYESLLSDWLFRTPTIRLAHLHATGDAPVFAYELTEPAPADGALGAYHGADVPLVFGNFTGTGAARGYPTTPSARTEALGCRMRAAWADFAHTGLPGWPAIVPGDGGAQIFGGDCPFTRTSPPEAMNRRIDVLGLPAQGQGAL
ncbi:carboxylesterase family protein [Streptomyces sp. Lzd4kr]|nr:carboxylesterase family protein [Streptomyces sp. Lzd4kr]